MHSEDPRSDAGAVSSARPTSDRSKSGIALLLCAASVIVVAAIASKAVLVPGTTKSQSEFKSASTTQSRPANHLASASAVATPDTATVIGRGIETSLSSNTNVTSARVATSKRAAKSSKTELALQLPQLPALLDDVSASASPMALSSRSFPAVSAPSVATDATPATTIPATGRSWQSMFPASGILFEVEGITDASSGTSSMSGAHALRTHESFAVTLDLDSLIGIRGLSFYAQREYRKGRNASGEAGLLQGMSNIDAENFSDWGEVFAEQRAFGDRLRIKAGRLDFNKEFAGTDNGGDFLNPAMGFSPSITAAPTYPLPAKGANVFYALHPQLQVAVGAFDGLDGAPAKVGGTSRFLIAQANVNYSIGQDLPGRTGIGAFKHTGVFASASESGGEAGEATEIAGTGGWYMTLDQTVWSGAVTGNEEPRTLGTFLQYGKSNPRVAGVQAHAGGGVVAAGVVPGLRSGVVGLGATRVHGSDGRELITELFYKTPLFSRLAVVMDGQRVNQVDVLGSRRTGNVFTLRTIVTF